MTVRRFIGICIKSVVLPLIAIFTVHRFNIFIGFNQISDDQAFDIGLACYLAIFEAAISVIENIIESKKANIVVTFSERKDDYDDESCPIMVYDSTKTVRYLWCHITLDGNYSILRNTSLEIALPSWLSSQSNVPYFTYSNDRLVIDLNRSLPLRGQGHHAIQNLKLPFIINSGSTTFEMTLLPHLNNKSPMIKLESKGFRAKIK